MTASASGLGRLERALCAAIAWCGPRADREWIAGDLAEDVERMSATHGQWPARRWLVAELGGAIFHALYEGARTLRPSRRQGDPRMQSLWYDVRYAIRLLRRSPGFTLTSILTLALAIGANAAIFSAVRGILIAPLPYPNPDRLIRLFEEAPKAPHFPMSPANFRDYRAELRTFEGLAAYMRNDLQLGEDGRPEQLRGMQVTAGFFGVVGHPPVLGREFTVDDEPKNESDDGVVISHALWLRRFGGDPAIVGRAVRLSGRAFHVIGVLPQGFQHVGGTYRTYGHGESVDVWWLLPIPRDDAPRHRFSHYFNVVGRLRPDVTTAAMQADLRITGESVARRYPIPNSPWTPRAVPLKDEIVGTSETTLAALSLAAALVLLLACVNVAGLLLGRAADREREIGVRSALGATRLRLIRQLLIESAVLATSGGTLGVGLAFLAVAALARYGPADTPRLQMIAVDGQVLAYTLAATVVSALLFGLTPAVQLARSGVADALKQGGRSVAGGAHQRVRRVLAGVEIALAFVLVASSALLLRSFVKLASADPGFVPGGAITASIELPRTNYPTHATNAAFNARALERVHALPGVREVGLGSDLPWTGYDENTGFAILGRASNDEDGPGGRYHFISPGYVAAVGTPIVAGRDLSQSDAIDAPKVVLVNESLARKYWTTVQSAVGARIKVWGEERSIAGVVGDVRDMPWAATSIPALYFPEAQQWFPQRMYLVVRSDIEPSSLVEPMRAALAGIDPALPLANVTPLAAVADGAIAARRLTLWLVAVFGVTALLLAVVGIYGVMAQAVGQRRHEFGVRQALGATRADIMRIVLSSGVVLTAVGLIGGLLLSAFSVRLFASMLYGVRASDPMTFTAVTLLMLVTALTASFLPAYKATRVSPSIALRDLA